MDKPFESNNALKRKHEISIREDDFFGLFNGVPYKKRHQNNEEIYNIGNKSVELLPSFQMEMGEPSHMQKTPIEPLYNEIIFMPLVNKPTFKIEEFLEISSDDTTEDSFLKDFPQENFQDIYLYWEYEEDDYTFIQEIFYLQEISLKKKTVQKPKKTPPANTKTRKKKEIPQEIPFNNNMWVDYFTSFNNIRFSEFDLQFLVKHFIRTMQDDNQKQIINIS